MRGSPWVFHSEYMGYQIAKNNLPKDPLDPMRWRVRVSGDDFYFGTLAEAKSFIKKHKEDF